MTMKIDDDTTGGPATSIHAGVRKTRRAYTQFCRPATAGTCSRGASGDLPRGDWRALERLDSRWAMEACGDLTGCAVCEAKKKHKHVHSLSVGPQRAALPEHSQHFRLAAGPPPRHSAHSQHRRRDHGSHPLHFVGHLRQPMSAHLATAGAAAVSPEPGAGPLPAPSGTR